MTVHHLKGCDVPQHRPTRCCYCFCAASRGEPVPIATKGGKPRARNRACRMWFFISGNKYYQAGLCCVGFGPVTRQRQRIWIQEVKKIPFSLFLNYKVPCLDLEVQLRQTQHSQGQERTMERRRGLGGKHIDRIDDRQPNLSH
ncbi:hypothetical protein VPH35_089374 [Triticum aestivum]